MMGKKKCSQQVTLYIMKIKSTLGLHCLDLRKKGIIKGTKKIANLNDNVGEKVQTIRIEEIKRKANVLNDK